jgi:hypothetical protein
MGLLGKTKFLYSKFNHLLITLLLLILIFPYWQQLSSIFSLPTLFFLISVVMALRIVSFKPKRYAFFVSIAVFAYGLNLINNWRLITERPLPALEVLTALIYVVFLFTAVCSLIKKVFKARKVTADTIAGGISIYLLIGILWTIIYRIFYYFDTSAFLVSDGSVPNFLFYSFVTLTTLGYGDITPAKIMVQNLSILEAVAGQMFLAILIARIVGLYIAHEMRQEK